MIHVQKIQTLTGHRDCVYTLERGEKQNQFFSGAGDGMIVLWDLQTFERPVTPDHEGDLIAKLPNSVYALHYLSDQNLLIAGHNYDGIHLLDWKAKKELNSLQLGKAAIFDIQSFQNDLFVASGDGTISVVDIQNWIVKKKIIRSDKSARTIAINERQGELAVGYSDHCIRVFSLDDYKLKAEWKAHENSIFCLAYSNDSNILISGSRDARLKAWDATSGYSKAGEVAAHLYAINHLEFSPNGKHFVTCSLDKSIKVWDFDNLKLLKVIDKARHAGHGTSVNKLLWTSFNDHLISASDDRTVSVWNIIF
ncbi:MAG: WD40 repeat domain-containing protein [Bacteroidia bacterium]|nr:WD40 repeat domain-containing protein [Bacteroidia bacterium]